MPDILILGASSDIAGACAQTYAEKGFKIWLAGRNIDLLNMQAADLKIRHNAEVHVLEFDALDVSVHESFVSSLSFIPDIVLLAFGYLGDQALAEQNWDECSKIINSNYVGAISILNQVANLFQQHQKGVIVVLSSVAGNRGKKSNYIYGSAKAGLTAYLSGLRNRLYFYKVHVVTVLPGFVNTKMTDKMNLPKALTAQPEAVASAIYNAVSKKKNIVYVKPIWRYIMFAISNVPESIYKKLSLGE